MWRWCLVSLVAGLAAIPAAPALAATMVPGIYPAPPHLAAPRPQPGVAAPRRTTVDSPRGALPGAASIVLVTLEQPPCITCLRPMQGTRPNRSDPLGVALVWASFAGLFLGAGLRRGYVRQPAPCHARDLPGPAYADPRGASRRRKWPT